MSQDFIDDELFADFIIEAKEHLETIEPNLLDLEKDPTNLSLLNEIFRPMHSLKGASGFLGLNNMNRLAHKAENILDELRKGTMAVTSEIMDVILASTDALRQMIDNLETSRSEGDVDTTSLMATLDELMQSQTHSALAQEAPAPSSTSLAPAQQDVASSTTQTNETVNDNIGATTSEQVNDDAFATKLTGDVSSWIESLPRKQSYALNSFGEGHLKDFVEEAKENTSSLTDGLLELEKPSVAEHDEHINDLFRLFHNLKGNSGILGYTELNSLTHEAETLLNAVRKGSSSINSALVDLLLLVVDTLDALIACIDQNTGEVTPFETQEVLDKLQQAVAGGAIELPESLLRLSSASQTSSAAEHSTTHDADNNATHTPDQDKIAAFTATIQQQISLMSEALAGMKKDGSNMEYADAMFRALSTVQNACSFMQLETIRVYAERTAGIIDQGRSSHLDFSLLTDLLEQETAIIRDMLQDAIAAMHTPQEQVEPAVQSETLPPQAPTDTSDNPQPPPPSVQAPAAPKSAPTPAKGGDENIPKTSSTIRVDHEKLDHLMNLIGELIINRNRYAMLARQLEERDKVDIGIIAQNLSETTYAMARISDDLQDTIMKVRMVPVASVFSRFPRLVRDLSRKSGKEVELIVEGDDTELDKSVVEVIGDPLVHLIRNSVDHGIEPDELREAAGKTHKGKVYLRAYYKGNFVAIEVEDDGKGIDPEKMRAVAVRKGILTAEDARGLDDREAMELIFAPGFSSAETITDISGRGVGMDVVRTNIKNLKGSISIQSEIGKGTKFTMLLPLTLAIIDALMVNVADEMYAIPLDAVSETTKIEAERLTDVKGRKAVTLRGEVLGIVCLAELLGLPSKMDEQELLSVVVIQDNERRLGLVVDSLLERQEIVIKPLGAYLGDLKGISGATIMGDGSVILILEPHEIYMLATSKSS